MKKIRKIIRKFGFDIVRFPHIQNGQNPFNDMVKFIKNNQPTIFDIGANEGQSIKIFNSEFPKAKIYSFEPSPSTFKTLIGNTSNINNLHLYNFALGSTNDKMIFFENEQSDMSSFLPLSEFGWGKVTKETLVEVKTIDHTLIDLNIDYIDILKCDTQGFEFEIFKGAIDSFHSNKIGLIYFEIIFSNMYNNLPSFSQIYDFLINQNFLLVSFYDFHYQKKIASWTDALFIHKSYLESS